MNPWDATLRDIVDAAVPAFAEACLVDVVEDDGSVCRLAVGDVEGSDRGDVQARATVPLMIRGRQLGAITFVGRRYSDHDLLYAQGVALQAAHAIDTRRRLARLKQAVAAMAAAATVEDVQSRIGAVAADLVDGIGAAIVPSGAEADLAIPLIARDRSLGALAVTLDPARPLDDDDLALLDVLASQTALVLAKAQQLERTRSLHQVSARLSRALTAVDIADVVVIDGALALGARGAALWLFDEEGEELLLRANNYPTARPPTGAVSAQVRLDGRVLGRLAVLGIGLEDDPSALAVLAGSCAQALERARLYEAERAARRDAELAHDRLAFLAEASKILAASLDPVATMQNIAALTVPRMADWCAVDLEQQGGPPRVTVAHADPAKVRLAAEWRRRWPPRDDDTSAVWRVMHGGAPELHAEIPDALLVQTIEDREQLAVARELGLRSAVIVPIRTPERAVGALTLIMAESGRRYGRADLEMAVQLAERAGLAIANAELYERAVRAIGARDDFLSIAGHELKTPLTALMLQAQSLTRLDGKARERGEKVLRHTRRLAGLIDELLDVSRIRSGRFELDVAPVDLVELVGGVAAGLADDAARAGIELRVDLRGPLDGEWDGSRLELVITNLIANAIKYGEGQPIDVIAEADGDRTIVTVRDRGIGIGPDDQQRIFERFERAVPNRHFGGLGLGLWIAKQIVEAHGGTIGVTSAPGSGAEFRVELPSTPPAGSSPP